MDLVSVAAADPAWPSLARGVVALSLGAAAVGLALWWRIRRQLAALERALVEVSTQIGAAAVDPRTGLIAADDFEALLDEEAVRCDRGEGGLALLFVDIDGFARVNDAYGHGAGDAVLREVAERLHKASPAKRAAMRFGGDETLLLVRGDLEVAQRQARALLHALGLPFEAAAGRTELLTASIGIAAYPDHGARPRLRSHALTAMREVKQSGGNGFAVYDPQMAIDQQAEAALLADLREAIARRQFALHYQPKVAARSLQITAAEALLRWQHPSRGVVSPTVFIPLAERHGLIGEIGDWVIEEACRQAGVWRDAGLRMRVAINLSAHQMRHCDVVERIESALRRHRLQPGRFTVEITESLALENTAATQATFEGLRRAGLHVAIDDFGAGQTSLAYLRRLPAAELKMDMSLVQDLATSADARAIAEAVVRLAHALERHVVAEGVETPEQRDLLIAMGCDELQGFLFARPMTAAALALWAMDDGDTPAPEFSASLFQATLPAELD
ncbi:MAG TPA: bifunctional diguanylate cyclase/phosphodiesterase [Methylibium sp.]|nr:bifunctional diguanylate cyclase/phosphodiesterase [Methylibium sp.]